MLVSQSVGYKGSPLQAGFTGFLHVGSFFVAISIEEGINPQVGETLLANVKRELQTIQVTNLSTFESEITNIFLKLNFPAHFNLAIGFLLQDVLYIKTVGKGQIYFRRGKEFDLLMDGDKSASGYLQEYDMAIFTSSKIHELIGTAEDIKAFVDLNPPKEIQEKMVNEGYGEEATGFSALFVEFLSPEAAELQPPIEEDQSIPQQTEQPTTPTPEIISAAETEEQFIQDNTTATHPPQQTVTPPVPPAGSEVESVSPSISAQASVPPPIPAPQNKFSVPFFSSFQFRQSKKISLVIVVILFVILLWSVVFGYQRRMAADMQKKIEATQIQIQSNLAKAEDEAYLNIEGSIALIEESKSLVHALEEEVGDNKQKEISDMRSLIDQAEARIVKRDEKEATEFYDLGLESKNAQGSKLYLEHDTVAMLDRENKTVYVLSLDNKSIDKYTASEVSGATLVATYNDSVFILNPERGIYEFTTATRVERVIEANGWGDIVDMQIYNGNIYLLDAGKNDIYKYVVAEGGYSNKASYFAAGQNADLSDSVGMTIDSALYIAKESEVLKFLSGASDSFTTEYPEKVPTLSGIFTTADMEQVYVWDNSTGSIYVLNKQGKYDRQLAASIVRKAKGVFIYDTNIYVFDGERLYTIALD
ncbi:MAG TPA: hypothetical protein PLS49_04670 [Candidatus Woesebacteria bacterium]|nr:hypothetical protein [Candidatus Woesebacteria bacterium]